MGRNVAFKALSFLDRNTPDRLKSLLHDHRPLLRIFVTVHTGQGSVHRKVAALRGMMVVAQDTSALILFEVHIISFQFCHVELMTAYTQTLSRFLCRNLRAVLYRIVAGLAFLFQKSLMTAGAEQSAMGRCMAGVTLYTVHLLCGRGNRYVAGRTFHCMAGDAHLVRLLKHQIFCRCCMGFVTR